MRLPNDSLGPLAQNAYDFLCERGDCTLDEIARHVYGGVDPYTKASAQQLIANLRHRHNIIVERHSIYRLPGRSKRGKIKRARTDNKRG